ncbi:hypothetical protein BYT27DRAFT_7244365 [Phlegmacium glaucopus]|nr:hypothetical protein BYT27DRAFT_7244365 [Phlegmacium glaucopus]
MLFFYNRVLLTAITALALLQFTVARPLLLTEDNALVERSEASKNAPIEHDWLYRRQGKGQITKEPKANPYKPKEKPPSAPVKKPQPPNNQNQRKALPSNTKLQLGDHAREELDKMGLHGKPRRDMIKWHKTQVKNEMKTNPLLKDKAKSGVIQHLAHEGGSDPKEKNHITASFHDKDKKPISNDFNGGINHHVYVDTKGMSAQGKAGWNKNNAEIRGGQSIPPPDKGKGKQKSGKEFSKNPEKGFQTKS